MAFGYGLCVLVHWIDNKEHALTPAPRPLDAGEGSTDRRFPLAARAGAGARG